MFTSHLQVYKLVSLTRQALPLFFPLKVGPQKIEVKPCTILFCGFLCTIVFHKCSYTWNKVRKKRKELEDRSQKKKIMFLHSKNKASRKGYKGEC